MSRSIAGNYASADDPRLGPTAIIPVLLHTGGRSRRRRHLTLGLPAVIARMEEGRSRLAGPQVESPSHPFSLLGAGRAADNSRGKRSLMPDNPQTVEMAGSKLADGAFPAWSLPPGPAAAAFARSLARSVLAEL